MLWVRNFNPEIHHRRSFRLKHYDYSQSGYYFITLCCYNRECLFGEIKEGKMILNDFGRIAHDEWVRSANIRSEIELDEFVVMPNHFHAIVIIRDDSRSGDHCRGDQPVAPTDSVQYQSGDQPVAPTRPIGPKPKSISSLMAGYKSSATKIINQLRNNPGDQIWQRNYYEHVIRDGESLIRIRQYINDNPVNWTKDEFYF